MLIRRPYSGISVQEREAKNFATELPVRVIRASPKKET